jgi:hypothetical protein
MIASKTNANDDTMKREEEREEQERAEREREREREREGAESRIKKEEPRRKGQRSSEGIPRWRKTQNSRRARTGVGGGGDRIARDYDTQAAFPGCLAARRTVAGTAATRYTSIANYRERITGRRGGSIRGRARAITRQQAPRSSPVRDRI